MSVGQRCTVAHAPLLMLLDYIIGPVRTILDQAKLWYNLESSDIVELISQARYPIYCSALGLNCVGGGGGQALHQDKLLGGKANSGVKGAEALILEHVFLMLKITEKLVVRTLPHENTQYVEGNILFSH